MKSLVVCLLSLLVSASTASAEAPTVSGQVRLLDGSSVGGAQVLLFDVSDLRRGALGQATTDADGQFALPLASSGGRGLPQGFALGQNYPNPFNPSTVIPYQLASSGYVRLEVFNVLGQRVATLVDGERLAGAHTAVWTATDAAGQAVSAGLYFYRLTAGEATATGRMVLVDGQAGVAAAGVRVEALRQVEAPAAANRSYGLVVSGIGLATYVDAALRVEAGMEPLTIELAVPGRAKIAQGDRGILGDVDNDGQVTLIDALLVAMYIADPATVLPNGGNIALGEVNGDGVIDITDAWLIATYTCDPSAIGDLPIGQSVTVGPLVGGFDAPTKLNSGHALQPAWSPDGTKIAFASNRDGSWHIYVMNADGSGTPTKLTRTGSNEDPAWSVYGIAFSSYRDDNRDIYVMSSAGESGGAATKVTAGNGGKRSPSWFGVLLGYSWEVRDKDVRIYTIHKDDRSNTEWTKGHLDFFPAFSPIDAVIAFSRVDEGLINHTADLYVLRLDGSDPVRLTNAGYNAAAAWSPDGTKIAFESGPNHRETKQLYVMNANGNTPPTQLTNRGSNVQPAWSPDGTKIAFASNRDGTWEIYVAAYGAGTVVTSPTGGGGSTGQEQSFSLPGGAEMEFVWIGPGVFQMGSPASEEGRWDDEGPLHEVEISRGFWLGKYEVTQGEWESVMGSNPSYYKGDSRRPVERISWNDVQEFIAKLNGAAGSAVYRLPTEAEWEYACRAGTSTRWSFGDDAGRLGNYAWYRGNNSPSGTKVVGGKLPNDWGLHDMHGNVWEWVQDWYDSGYYNSPPRVDPPGPDTGSDRVFRGGYFNNLAQDVRSAARSSYSPGLRSNGIGVRLVRIR